ncbi:MAG: hypothetical protein IJM09_03350 [Neisseriaceae bacterium]|nr:hypothetical protein [Neisseriaceae bacterium]
MALTYSKKETLSKRIEFWSPIIDIIIDIIINKLIKQQKPLVVILWGKKANKIKNFPLEKDKENETKGIYILRSSHPSNMGNAKNKQLKNGIKSFSEMEFFKKTNEILEKSDWKTGIDWNT